MMEPNLIWGDVHVAKGVVKLALSICKDGLSSRYWPSTA